MISLDEAMKLRRLSDEEILSLRSFCSAPTEHCPARRHRFLAQHDEPPPATIQALCQATTPDAG